MRIVQLSNLEVYNPDKDQLVSLVQANVIAWAGKGPSGFYWKLAIEGPIRIGKNGEYYRVKVNVPVQNVEPTSPIVVIN